MVFSEESITFSQHIKNGSKFHKNCPVCNALKNTPSDAWPVSEEELLEIFDDVEGEN